ncbi:hypothetical protein JAAN108728_10210 [Janibacter anophelis]
MWISLTARLVMWREGPTGSASPSPFVTYSDQLHPLVEPQPSQT